MVSSPNPTQPPKKKNFYSTETLQDMLQRYSDVRGGAKVAPSFEELKPKELDFRPIESSMQDPIQDLILNTNKQATNVERVKQGNAGAFNALKAQQQAYKQAQQQNQQLTSEGLAIQNSQQQYAPYVPTPGKGDKTRWGSDGVPQVRDLGQVNPNAPIQTYKWKGHSIRLNNQVAPVFLAFLDELYSTGYRPMSIGGHADRNIAGTNKKSLHSYGFAIDIDPGKHPVTWNGKNQTTFSPAVGAMAARYGLAWGGAWTGSKRDPMHFSVPYGGRK